MGLAARESRAPHRNHEPACRRRGHGLNAGQKAWGLDIDRRAGVFTKRAAAANHRSRSSRSGVPNAAANREWPLSASRRPAPRVMTKASQASPVSRPVCSTPNAAIAYRRSTFWMARAVVAVSTFCVAILCNSRNAARRSVRRGLRNHATQPITAAINTTNTIHQPGAGGHQPGGGGAWSGDSCASQSWVTWFGFMRQTARPAIAIEGHPSCPCLCSGGSVTSLDVPPSR